MKKIIVFLVLFCFSLVSLMAKGDNGYVTAYEGYKFVKNELQKAGYDTTTSFCKLVGIWFATYPDDEDYADDVYFKAQISLSGEDVGKSNFWGYVFRYRKDTDYVYSIFVKCYVFDGQLKFCGYLSTCDSLYFPDSYIPDIYEDNLNLILTKDNDSPLFIKKLVENTDFLEIFHRIKYDTPISIRLSRLSSNSTDDVFIQENIPYWTCAIRSNRHYQGIIFDLPYFYILLADNNTKNNEIKCINGKGWVTAYEGYQLVKNELQKKGYDTSCINLIKVYCSCANEHYYDASNLVTWYQQRPCFGGGGNGYENLFDRYIYFIGQNIGKSNHWTYIVNYKNRIIETSYFVFGLHGMFDRENSEYIDYIDEIDIDIFIREKDEEDYEDYLNSKFMKLTRENDSPVFIKKLIENIDFKLLSESEFGFKNIDIEFSDDLYFVDLISDNSSKEIIDCRYNLLANKHIKSNKIKCLDYTKKYVTAYEGYQLVKKELRKKGYDTSCINLIRVRTEDILFFSSDKNDKNKGKSGCWIYEIYYKKNSENEGLIYCSYSISRRDGLPIIDVDDIDYKEYRIDSNSKFIKLTKENDSPVFIQKLSLYKQKKYPLFSDYLVYNDIFLSIYNDDVQESWQVYLGYSSGSKPEYSYKLLADENINNNAIIEWKKD